MICCIINYKIILYVYLNRNIILVFGKLYFKNELTFKNRVIKNKKNATKNS